MTSLAVKDGNGALQSLKTTTTSSGQVVHHNADTDYFIRAAQLQNAAHTLTYYHGESSSVNTSLVDIWPSGTMMTYPAVAAAVSVVSSSANDTSAGSGARTVLVFGLDANYASVNNVIFMNGTTPVNTGNSFLRVSYLLVVSAGATGWNEGTITATIGGQTVSVMTIGDNKSMAARYTVPAGFTAIVSSMYASSTVADAMQISLWKRDITRNVFEKASTMELYQKSSQIGFINGALLLAGPRDEIVMRAQRLSGAGAVKVTGGFSLVQVQ